MAASEAHSQSCCAIGCADEWCQPAGREQDDMTEAEARPADTEPKRRWYQYR